MQPKISFALNAAGEVASLRFDKTEFVGGTVPTGLFEIQFRDFVGNPLRLNAADFAHVKIVDGSPTVIEFSRSSRLPRTAVTVTISAVGGESVWRLTVTRQNDDFKVEWIDFPRIRLNNHPDGKTLLPFAEGTLVADLKQRPPSGVFGCELTEYPMTGINSFYPGPAPMPMVAYYTPQAGLCCYCRDFRHGPKTVDVLLDGADSWRFMLQHFTGGEPEIGYETVIAGFHGGWQDAAQIYRDWLEANDPVLPAKLKNTMPEWYAQAPVLLIYPVKGAGLDIGGVDPNEYFPYDNALPCIQKYQQLWGGPVMALLMHWEGTAPWAPPYVWPPFGGEEQLQSFAQKMHQKGNLVGLYGSGIGWTQKSMIDPSYDCTQKFVELELQNEICVGPRGETFSRVCNGPCGQRIGYDLCPASQVTTAIVAGEIAAAANIKIDYLQYFDQNQGCAAPLCYAKDHRHPALPGAWETAAMQALLDRAAGAAGNTVLGCENGAAEPYFKDCRLNDLRSHLAWGAGGVPVPLYSFLYHEYVSGFSGNGVCLSAWIDVEATPFFRQWELAWHFAFGNLLSVVLKDGGQIHWHWALPWSIPGPEQAPLSELVANLSFWKRNHAAEYLSWGKMQKAPRISCGVRDIYLRNRPKVSCEAVIAAAWSYEGKHAVILVNFDRNAEPCRLDFDQTSAGTVIARNGRTRFAGSSLSLTVPPLDALLIEFDSFAYTEKFRRK